MSRLVRRGITVVRRPKCGGSSCSDSSFSSSGIERLVEGLTLLLEGGLPPKYLRMSPECRLMMLGIEWLVSEGTGACAVDDSVGVRDVVGSLSRNSLGNAKSGQMSTMRMLRTDPSLWLVYTAAFSAKDSSED